MVAITIGTSGEESDYSNEVELIFSVDTDRDGISDYDERTIYKTDPKRADSDGDGIDDGEELKLWGDAWGKDADGDGLSNLLDRDADNDGIADGTEVDAHHDPADPDSHPIQRTPKWVQLPVKSVKASKGKKQAARTIDGKPKTYWSAKGDGQWIMYDIGTTASVAEVAIAWVKGNRRKASFTIETSVDGTVWHEVLSDDSSGNTRKLEPYTFDARPARYVRVVGYGNSSNQKNEIAETEIYGQLTLTRQS